MLTIKMNDTAARALELLAGAGLAEPAGGLAAGLRDIVNVGILRRGRVLVWANSSGNAGGAPTIFHDLTGWECSDSSFHIEDYVSVPVAITDGSPAMDETDQRILLAQGLAFGRRFAGLVYELPEPSPVRCIISANVTCATFRFHQIRPGETWNVPELDRYKLDKVIVIDIDPAQGHE